LLLPCVAIGLGDQITRTYEGLLLRCSYQAEQCKPNWPETVTATLAPPLFGLLSWTPMPPKTLRRAQLAYLGLTARSTG
jgi:hypothetical protein